jgi:hypothetical protein
MLRVYNQTARFVNQGGGKRMGSFAVRRTHISRLPTHFPEQI